MNQRFVSVLLFAFVVAAGSSLLLYRLTAARMLQAKPAAGATQLMVAARNLEVGALIRESDLKLSAWAGPLPAGALTRKEDITGRGVVAAVYQNEPILETRLAPRGAGGGLAAMIPAGMRAVAVRVNEVVGVAGFVVPGMRVDVLISGNPPGAAGPRLGSVTKTLLQNIQVLSAGQDFKKDAEGKPVQVQVVNLLVTPAQAEKLSLATNQATIQLVLRNPLDTEVATTPGTALAQLFSTAAASPQPAPRRAAQPALSPPLPAPKAAEPAPTVFIIETIHGTKRVETKFAGSSEAQQ